MAQNEINIKVKISDDGSLSLVSKKAKDAAKSTEELTQSRNRYQRGEKGVAGATSNSTKAFSKMQQAMGGGLVPAYATLAANVFALSAAFGVLRRAAQVEQLSAGISTLGTASGLAMDTLSRGLQEATGHALSLEEAMRSTAMITSAGLDPSMINQFGEAAKNAAIALGRNTQDSLERFTRGVTKLEPELLDELGIFVKLDEAYESYANKLDKNVTQLTSFEKRQAFANATLEEANQKFGAIGDVDANPYDKLAAAFADVSKAFLGIVNSGIIPFLTLLLENTGLLISATLLFGSTISGKLIGSLTEYASSAKDAADMQKAVAASNINGLNSLNKSSKTLTALTTALAEGTETSEHFTAALDGQTQSLVSNQKNLKKGDLLAWNKGKQRSAEITHEVRKAQLAHTLSTAQSAQAEAFAAMATGNYKEAKEKLKESFSGLGKAMKIATLQTTLLSKALAMGRVAAMLASGAFRVLGGAVSLLLGPVGIAIAIFTTLYEVVKGIFNFFKSPETKALEEVVSQAAETAKELDKNFKEANLAVEGQSKVINSVTQRYIALGNASSQLLNILEQMQNTEASDNQEEQVDFLQERVKGSLALTAALKEAGIVKINTGNLEKAKKVIEEVAIQGQKTASVKEAFKNLNDETTQYFNTLSKTTPVDGMADSLRNLMNSLASTEDIEDIVKIIDEGIGTSGRLREMFDQAEGSSQKEKLQTLTQIIAAEQSRIRTGQQIIAAKESEVKILKGLNKLSTEGVKELLAAEKILLQTKIQQIQGAIEFQESQKKSAKDAEQLEQIEAEIARLKAQQGELQVQIKTGAEELVVIQSQVVNNLKEQQAIEKSILGFFERELQLLEAKNSLEEAAARRAVRLKASAQGRSVTAAEEAKLAQQEAANLVESEGRRIAIRTATINMEYDLLEEQYKLEQFRLQVLYEQEQISKDAYDRLNLGIGYAMGNLGNQRTKAVENVEAQEKNITAEGQGTAQEATNAAIEESRRAALEYAKQYADILREAGEYDKSLALQQATNQAEITRLRQLQKDEDDPVANLAIQKQINALILEGQKLERQRLQLNPAEQQALQLEQARINLLRERGTIQEAISAQEALNNEQIKILQTELDAEVTTLERKLEIEREIAALRQSNVGLTQESIGIAGETAIRMGAPEGMTNAVTGIAQDTADPEGVMAQGTTSEKFAFLKEQTEGFMSDLAQLSPEGAVIAAMTEGALAMGEAFSTAFEEMKSGGLSVQTAMQAVGATISAINQIQQAKANAAVAAIDKEIAAEKKRDGKSQESIAKIKKLEAQKDKIKRKAFEQDKRAKMAGVIMGTAQSIMNAMATIPFPGNIAMAAVAAAMGAAQLAAISSTSYQGGGSSPDTGSAPTTVSLGQRRTSTDLAISQGAAGELAYFRGARGIGGPENFQPAASGMKYRANGGNTAFMVGEQGPEMFIPERPGTILPADETAQFGPSINANINISALDADGVEDILMNQRGNIIGMLRDAANANGETFLESVSLQEV